MIQDRLAIVRDKPNAYAILNGDILNNATKTSISDSYAEEIPPMQQIEKCVELFEPIKDKIICINGGNHERRSYNKEGIDIMEIAAIQLKLGKKYSPGASFVFLRFGEEAKGKGRKDSQGNPRPISYTIFSNHGAGGGRRPGAKINRLEDMAGIVDADIYIHSHTHLPAVMKQSFYRVNINNSTILNVDKLFVNTAATLDYGGYGEIFEYKPSSKENPVIYLNGNKKEMRATL